MRQATETISERLDRFNGKPDHGNECQCADCEPFNVKNTATGKAVRHQQQQETIAAILRNKPATTGDVSNHSRVSDVALAPKNDSEGEIERLRAINAQLVAALRELASAGIASIEETSNTQERRTARKRFLEALSNGRAALNAAEKESNK